MYLQLLSLQTDRIVIFISGDDSTRFKMINMPVVLIKRLVKHHLVVATKSAGLHEYEYCFTSSIETIPMTQYETFTGLNHWMVCRSIQSMANLIDSKRAVYCKRHRSGIQIYSLHWGQVKMVNISQTTCSNAFPWMKTFEILFDNMAALLQIMAWHRTDEKP